MDIIYHNLPNLDLIYQVNLMHHIVKEWILAFDTLYVTVYGDPRADHFEDDLYAYTLGRIIGYLVDRDDLYLDRLHTLTKLELTRDLWEYILIETNDEIAAQNFLENLTIDLDTL
jgi:hypothetical protein